MIYSPSDLAEKYIPILFRTRRYQEVLELLSDPLFNPFPGENQIWLKARTQMETGELADAVDTVKEGLSYYSNSRKLYSLLFSLVPGELERYSGLVKEGTINHPDLVEALIPLLIGNMDRPDRELIEIYDHLNIFDLKSEISRIQIYGLNDLSVLGELSEKGTFYGRTGFKRTLLQPAF